MPRTRTLAWSQLKIGILAVAAFTLATMLIFAVGGDAGLFSGKYHLKTRFPNAGGLASGSIVRLAGVNVGAVDEVYLDGAVVEVVLRIRPDVQNKITELFGNLQQVLLLIKSMDPAGDSIDLEAILQPLRRRVDGLLAGDPKVVAEVESQRRSGLGLSARDTVDKLYRDRFEALPENVPHFMKVSLCRFAQQCLHNAFQHAGGNSQRLEAWSDGSMVFVCISDAGPGMDVASAGVDGKRLGLYGLVNRIEAWGGRIDIQSAPGRGTQITAAMPIATDKDGNLL